MAAIFFDIDGTLWDRENRIPDSTKEAMELLHEKGHLIFLCSGRTRAMIKSEALLSLGFDGIVGGCGTQLIYRDESLFCHEIDRDLLKRTIGLLNECRMPVLLEGETYLYMDRDVAENVYGRYIAETLGEYVRPLAGNEDNWRGSKLTALIQDGDYDRAAAALAKDFHVLKHGKIVTELVPLGYSKADGIKRMCSYLDIPHEDTFAFGDSINDRDMLLYASCGIAMGNGTDAAKEAADYITDDIHQDGIYNGLKHFDLI